MITGLNTAVVWVLDQDSARKFYTDILGLEVRVDLPFGEGMRWITVGTPKQPDVQVTLMVPGPPTMDPESAEQLKSLIAKGVLSSCTFTVTECQAAYDELSSRGARFVQPPSPRPWGTSAILRDDSGSSIELLQPGH